MKGVRIGIAGNLKSKIDEAVSKHEENYVKSQTKVYKEWNDKREQDLEAQKDNFEKQAKLQEIEQTKVKLDEKKEKGNLLHCKLESMSFEAKTPSQIDVVLWCKFWPQKLLLYF